MWLAVAQVSCCLPEAEEEGTFPFHSALKLEAQTGNQHLGTPTAQTGRWVSNVMNPPR